MKWILALVLTLAAPALQAQQNAMTWDEFVEYVSTDENTDGEDWNDYIDALYELHQHPIDINTASLQDLKQIPILSDRQAEDLRIYILTFGEMKTMGELLAITSIDRQMRRILPLFITAIPNDRTSRDTLQPKDMRHDLLSRLDIPLYHRQGETEGKYQGRGVAHRLRYHCRANKSMEAGFGFEKDAYEPMTFPLGYDHYSGYVMLKDKGCMQTAIAGDYRMGWGEGLLVNNRFTMGKTAFSTTVSNGVTGHRSASEYNYLRGATVTLGNKLHALHAVTGTIFFSYRAMDANVNSTGVTTQAGQGQNANSEGYATSLNLSGTHRTAKEIETRHNQRQTMGGAHIAWHAGRKLNLGATAFAERYYKPFTNKGEAYKRYAPNGYDFWGASVDYNLRLDRFTWKGEAATNGQGIATLNHLSWRQNRQLTVTLSQRYYSPAYHSFMAHAFSEYGVQNEHGYYLCVNAEPVSDLTLQAYVDLFYRPYQTYRLPHSTHGQDVRLKAGYRINARHSLEARAQWKHKEAYYALYVSQKYLLAHIFTREAWSVKTQTQMHHYSTATGDRRLGAAVQSTARWHGKWWRAALSAAWFKTDDYYSRIYLSQPSVTGVQSSMFYGHGIASAATLRRDIRQWGIITLRYTIAAYFNRNAIASALQTIPHSTKNDITLQLQIKLGHKHAYNTKNVKSR